MSVLTALVCGVFSLFFYWCYGIYKKNKMLGKLPGPPPIPFFGTKLPSNVDGLLPMFEELFEKYGKTCKMYIGDSLYVATKDVNLIEPLLKSSVHIAKSQIYQFLSIWLKEGLIVSRGDKWRRRRKIYSSAFHFTTMKGFFPIFKESTDIIVKKLGEEADKGAVIDVIEYTTKFGLDVIGETSFGTKLYTQNGENKDFIQATKDILEVMFAKNFSAWKRFSLLFKLFATESYALQQKSLDILDGTAMNIIRDKRKYYRDNPNAKNIDDTDENINRKNCILMDVLMQQEEFSDEDILEEANNFLFAGHDTTSGGLAFAFYELSKCSDIQKRLYEEINFHIQNDINNLTPEILQDMKYLDMVVKEILRLRCPVPMIERRLEEDALLGDTLYPKGTTISILIYFVHHDSDLYPDPEKFDPERFSPENQAKRPPFSFIPFSAGPRNCIGQKYAIMEMKTAITQVILEFILHPVKDFKLELTMGSLLTSTNGFPVRLERRKR